MYPVCIPTLCPIHTPLNKTQSHLSFLYKSEPLCIDSPSRITQNVHQLLNSARVLRNKLL
ncbi:hypothetical protein BC827DRAFT_851582 [Russula dissimulans]|nr:hypothetical protein BC827DRAFT_851582 [Russula dissimulans]